jgi:hypothetical protein
MVSVTAPLVQMRLGRMLLHLRDEFSGRTFDNLVLLFA